MKKCFVAIGVVLMLAVVVWFGARDCFSPMNRENVQLPIYTIGDSGYGTALQEGKNIVKFGPAFWGLYPGGLAFKDVLSAEKYMKGNRQLLDKFSEGWAVYRLSGDFTLDTYVRGEGYYINRSLLVVAVGENP